MSAAVFFAILFAAALHAGWNALVKLGLTRAGLGWALATAAFTASYRLADGVGARVAGSASAFTLTRFVLDGLFMLVYGLATRGGAGLAALLPAWRGGVAAGAMSLGAYWIAIWGFTQAPLAMVAALRETSVLFAMLIGAVWLKERPGRRRRAGAPGPAAGRSRRPWTGRSSACACRRGFRRDRDRSAGKRPSRRCR